MSDELKNVLLQSNTITDSEKWDAEYDSLPVVIAESTATLDGALSKLDEVGDMAILQHGEKIYLPLILNYYQSDVG